LRLGADEFYLFDIREINKIITQKWKKAREILEKIMTNNGWENLSHLMEQTCSEQGEPIKQIIIAESE